MGGRGGSRQRSRNKQRFDRGQRVRYNGVFLRSMGRATDEWWTMDGTVLAQVAWVTTVQWDGRDKPCTVMARDLEVVQ